MNFAVIVSTKDTASINIKDNLVGLYGFVETSELFEGRVVYKLHEKIKIYTTERDLLYCDEIDKEINADLFVFASRHESKNPLSCLACHSPGNWGDAKYGGRDKVLCVAPAKFLKICMEKLIENCPKDYQVIQECTHHGPFLDKPSCFVEIGSGQDEWACREAGAAVARALMQAVSSYVIGIEAKIVVGLGGLHHTPNFKKLVLNHGVALGHVCPKYMLGALDRSVVIHAIERTMEKADCIVLDWKGLGEYKQMVKDIVNGLQKNIEIKKIKDFK